MPALTPLTESPSLDKLAYDQIKEAILTFKFLPNQALIEGELASQLGISKTPVRDALMRLEKEGLVVRVAYKGTYVSDINNDDMANIFQIRMALEGLAIRLAARRLTADDLRHMADLLESHKGALAARDFTRVSKINSEFHNVIISGCANPFCSKCCSTSMIISNATDFCRSRRGLGWTNRCRNTRQFSARCRSATRTKPSKPCARTWRAP